MKSKWVMVATVVATAVVGSFGLTAVGSATGASFMLGRTNKAPVTSTLTARAGTPLALRAAKGVAPLRVNNTTEVARLNAALVGGVGISGLQRPVSGSCPAGIASVAQAGSVTCAATQAVFDESGTWVVPAGVSQIDVSAIGAGGGGSVVRKGFLAGSGGAGAWVTSAIHVTSGEQLDIVLGQPGHATSSSQPATAGTATVVYRQTSSGALLVKAGGGSAGPSVKRTSKNSCLGGAGGVPQPATESGVTDLAADIGAVGQCTTGGGAPGFAGSGGSRGHSGQPGLVTITIVG